MTPMLATAGRESTRNRGTPDLNMIRRGAAARFGAGVMPIRPLLQGGSFSPEDITWLGPVLN
jgi:hypothetical protein